MSEDAPRTRGQLLLKLMAIIGVVSLLWTGVTLFTAFGSRPEQVTMAGSTPAAGSPEFRRALEAMLGAEVREGGSAEILVNGVEFLPALLREIDGAQTTLNFMVYVWSPGEMSDRLLESFLAAAGRGVEVRVMLDGHGAQEAPMERFGELEEAGGKVVVFRPLRPSTIARFHRRNHRRAIVIDGRVAFTGGAAVADTWLGNAQDSEHWRDDLVRVTGSLARSVQSAFVQLWAGASGEILVGPDFYPEWEAPPSGESISRHVAIASSPSSENHPLRRLFYLMFAAARKRIWITNPYVVPDPEVLEVLCQSAAEGVDVRILTAGRHSDMAVVRWASHDKYATLLEAGVRIYEYQPTLHHSKTLIIDDDWSVVGSPNLDVRSKELNEENALAIEDRSFNEALAAVFREDLEQAKEVELSAWRERPAWHRLREYAASLLEEQL